jgi:cytochrome c oxidase subunit 3
MLHYLKKNLSLKIKNFKNENIVKTQAHYMNNPYRSQRHPFHIVSPSPLPFFMAISVFFFVLSLIFYMHKTKYSQCLITPMFIFFLFALYNWFQDVNREGVQLGLHTSATRKNLRTGMVLFIVSEVMFFVSFFWAFFHSSLAPAMEIGFIWPPKGIQVIDPFRLPLLNTIILLSSGVSVTAAHLAVVNNSSLHKGGFAFFVTIIYGLFFTFCQIYEYRHATFNISDGIYGSVFYLATGFHGFHVIIGTIFLIVCFLKFLDGQYHPSAHVSLECAVWYWHFVDVVWIFLYVSIYWWGGSANSINLF